MQARGFVADVPDPVSIAAALENATETLGPIEFSIYGPVAAAHAELLHDVLGEEGIAVSRLIIGGAIDPDSDDTSPEALAEHLWEPRTTRTEFRRQVSED